MAMKLNRTMLAAGAAGAAVMMATPAMAGRCGHSYAVDAPTTLAKVARACNVSLSALREANTGVDPSYVRPGEHLAVPDEIASATDIPSGSADVGVDYSGSSVPIYQYAEYTEPAPQPSKPEAVVYTASSGNPYFVQASYTAPYVAEDDRLSYQQKSAARIRNAGVVRQTPVTLSPMRSYAPQAVTISTQTDLVTGDPVSPLMECAVLRRQPTGKIEQVREFKPVPEGRETPAHCSEITTVSMGAPLKAGPEIDVSDFLYFEYESLPTDAFFTVLKGYVSSADAECITLRSDDGMVWRVGVPLAPVEMLGKEATIWAEQTTAAQCGGLVMNRAVYAEQTN